MDDLLTRILGFSGVTLIGLLIWNLKRTIEQRDVRLDSIEKDIHTIKEELPKDYVSKVDYKSDIKDLKSGIDDIRRYIMDDKLRR
jgi:hypothetical protein